MADGERIASCLRGSEHSYIDVRALDDGSVIAIGDLIYTRAIYMDCSETGYRRRYCFSDRELAIWEFQKLRSDDDEPVGWVARR